MPLASSPDLAPYRTADGSITLRSERWNEQYHSKHGAVQESTHVYLNMGLHAWLAEHGARRPVSILEVGLGTGLNMLLTWIRCLEGKCTVEYTALEPDPLPKEQLGPLKYWEELAWPGLQEGYLKVMTEPGPHGLDGGMRFEQLRTKVQELDVKERFDMVYFDAFGPRTQPEMWTPDVFRQVAQSMRAGAMLVTYCAKGDVRRNMMSAGLRVERLPGPPGKREMLRARK